jgi:hypothetical protein
LRAMSGTGATLVFSDGGAATNATRFYRIQTR